MKLLKATNKDIYTIVDDDKYDVLSNIPWIYTKDGYFATIISRKSQNMGKIVANALLLTQRISYINNNKLDNRKENIKVINRPRVYIDNELAKIEFDSGETYFTNKEYYDLIKDYYWQINKKGYAFYQINKNKGKIRKIVMLHRMVLGATNGEYCDHINHDKFNCTTANLRFCTNSENMKNRPKNCLKTKGSIYKGICFKNNKWQATICCNNKSVYIGRFNTEEEAALAYNEKAIELHKEFACLNIIH